MAIYKIFPEKDTTIYSEYPNTNTGLDQILEISNKEASLINGPFVSRILIKFPTNEINNTINNIIGSSSFQSYLKLYLADATNLPDTYYITASALADSWEVGTGRFLYNPSNVNGCNWIQSQNGMEWPTSNYPLNVTASFLPNQPGGGNWNYLCNNVEFFEINQSKDINIEVTNIVQDIVNSDISNNGFLLKMEEPYEFNNSSSFSLKYFSKDTHTIYLPQLEFKWDDSVYNTGSLNVLTNENNVITLGNNVGKYNKDNIFRFRVNARTVYPARAFTTISVYTLNSALPSSSYWALQDLNTGEYVVDFDKQFTKISCDPQGNYFDLYMAGLQPERYYKITIKSEFDNGSVVVYDNNSIFKINK
jgi:hypothetical protein